MRKENLTLNLLSIDDLKYYTTVELLYRVVQYINDFVNINEQTQQELDELNDTLSKMMNEGLQVELISILEGWVESGRLTNLVDASLTRVGDIGLSVKHFGAVGDGFNDDTQAFKDVFAMVELLGGGTIIVPKGDYIWKEMLVIPSNTILRSAEGVRYIRSHDGSFLINGYDRDYEPYGAHGNITIDGGIWEGNPNRQNSAYNMLNFGKGENIKIINATFKDYSGGHVLDISGCRHVLVDNCRFEGFRPTTDRNYAEAIQLAEHTELGFSGIGGYDHSPCEHIVISNCYFGPSGTASTVGANGIGSHSSTHDVFNHDIKVINNTFEEAHFVAVRCFKYKDMVIQGNKFKNCARGVAISNVGGNSISSQDKEGQQTYQCQSGINVLVDGNIFEGTTINDIYVSGQSYVGDEITSVSNYDPMHNVIISHNVIRNSRGTNSLDIILTENLIIANNQILNNKNRAIRLLYGSNVKITNNIIDGGVDEGMYIYETENVFPELQGKGCSTHIDVTNNLIKNVGKTGIFLNGPIKYGDISNNCLENVCRDSAQANNRNGITLTKGCEGQSVTDNRILPSQGVMVYGVLVTNTCFHVTSSNNIGVGLTGGCYNGAIGGASTCDFIDYQNRNMQDLTCTFIGDSVTNADRYQRLVSIRCGFGGYQNVCENGITAIQMAQDLNNNVKQIPSNHVSVIFLGLNDFRNNSPLGKMEDTTQTVATFSSAIKRIIQHVYQAQPDDGTLILVAPYKCFEEGHYFSTPNEVGATLEDYVNMIKEIANFYSIPVVDLYHESGINTWSRGYFLQSDLLHPTWQGYQRIAMMMSRQMVNYL